MSCSSNPYMRTESKLSLLLAILALCLLLLSVTVQMAHTHPVTSDRDHRDCPACVFGSAFRLILATGFSLMVTVAAVGQVFLSEYLETSPREAYPPQSQRAPPLSCV